MVVFTTTRVAPVGRAVSRRPQTASEEQQKQQTSSICSWRAGQRAALKSTLSDRRRCFHYTPTGCISMSWHAAADDKDPSCSIIIISSPTAEPLWLLLQGTHSFLLFDGWLMSLSALWIRRHEIVSILLFVEKKTATVPTRATETSK